MSEVVTVATEEVSTPAPDSRKLRIFELALVVGVGFLPSTLYSLYDWWNAIGPSAHTIFEEVVRIVGAGLAISVLAYVLYRQGRSLRAIGLTFKASDVAWALVDAGAFFVAALFYAYKRRITPVILAHALHNFLVLVRY